MKRCKSCGACHECGAPLSYSQPINPRAYGPTTYPTVTYSSSTARSCTSTAGTYTTFKTNDGPDEAGALAPLH